MKKELTYQDLIDNALRNSAAKNKALTVQQYILDYICPLLNADHVSEALEMLKDNPHDYLMDLDRVNNMWEKCNEHIREISPWLEMFNELSPINIMLDIVDDRAMRYSYKLELEVMAIKYFIKDMILEATGKSK